MVGGGGLVRMELDYGDRVGQEKHWSFWKVGTQGWETGWPTLGYSLMSWSAKAIICGK